MKNRDIKTLLTIDMVTASVTKPITLSKTADYTVTDIDADIFFVTPTANTTITLPTVADNEGRTITVILDGDPGSYDVIVDGEGDETINGAATKTNSTQYSVLSVISNGTAWVISNSIGTWT